MSRPSLLHTAAALATTLALGFAACGDDDDDDGGSAASGGLARAELVREVEELCLAYDADLEELGAEPADFATNPVSAAAYLDKLTPLAESKALEPADDVAADFRAYTAGVDHQVGRLKSAQTKAHAKDPSGLQDVEAIGAYKTSTLDPAIKKLGANACLGS